MAFNLDFLGGYGSLGDACDPCDPCQPIVIHKDVAIPQPIAVRSCVVPRPFLPYCRRTRRGYPRW